MSACICDYDPPTWFRGETRKARKEHRCEACGCTVRSGEAYQYVFGKWHGIVDIFKTCERCVALRKWVEAHVPCVCWADGNQPEGLEEAIDEYAHECPGLKFGFLRQRVKLERRARADYREREKRRRAVA